MTTATLQRELRELQERQWRLEEVIYGFFGADIELGERVRPEYLRKLNRIGRKMDTGRGVATIHTRRELKKFFDEL